MYIHIRIYDIYKAVMKRKLTINIPIKKLTKRGKSNQITSSKETITQTKKHETNNKDKNKWSRNEKDFIPN